MKAGETAPPFHPGCRCTTAPYFEDMKDIGERWMRDPETGKGGYVPADMTFNEWKAEYVDKSGGSDIIKTSGAISGALSPYSKAALKHAELYYDEVRKMSNDIDRIAENTGFSKSDVFNIKNYIFYEKHQLEDGIRRFDPSFEMAQSWQRLIEGKDIKPHDITLLNHEKMERELVLQGLSQDEAHIRTSNKFNYKKEASAYYDKIKGNKKK